MKSINKNNDLIFLSKSHENLIDVNQLFFTLFKTVSYGILIANQGGEIVLVNERLNRMFEYDENELINQKVEVLIPISLRQKHAKERDLFNAHPVQRKMGVAKDLIGLKKTGDQFPVDINIGPITFDQEELFFAIIRDISAEKKKAHDNELIEVFLNEGPHPVFIISESNDIVYKNNPATQLLNNLAPDRLNQLMKDVNLLIFDIFNKKVIQFYTLSTDDVFLVFQVIPNYESRSVSFFGLDFSAIKNADIDLFNSTHYDPLTGIPNREFFYKRIEQQISMNTNHSLTFALLNLDIDKFKLINNHLGYAIGDKLLIEISKTIQNNLRNLDLFARFGSDEFVILFNQISTAEEAKAVANRIKKLLKKSFTISNFQIKLTVSIGIVIFPDNGVTTKTLFQSLDTALSHAKKLGGGCDVYFTSDVNNKYRRALALEYDLPFALEKNEMFLVYQPQINYKAKEIIGVEALLRWQHPKYGLVGPDDFILIAEKSGLIASIGFWVFDVACRTLQEWKPHSIKMSINLSLIQLSMADLANKFEKICQYHQIDPRQIVLELTETTLNNAIFDVDTVIRNLYEKGFSLAIDDFGTGYSSFSRLTKLPISTLKIDKSFVMNLKDNYENQIIIKAILSMSHGLGLHVIAEGISKEDELNFLISHGCHYMQGFYFGKPMLPHQIRSLLELGMKKNN